MKLKEQVVSLELAKEMKELGFEQESLYAYYRKGHYWCGSEEIQPAKPTLEKSVGKCVDFPYEFVASAYTVAECLELIEKLHGHYPMLFSPDKCGKSYADQIAEKLINYRRDRNGLEIC